MVDRSRSATALHLRRVKFHQILGVATGEIRITQCDFLGLATVVRDQIIPLCILLARAKHAETAEASLALFLALENCQPRSPFFNLSCRILVNVSWVVESPPPKRKAVAFWLTPFLTSVRAAFRFGA